LTEVSGGGVRQKAPTANTDKLAGRLLNDR
jgi:hypothetical protein